MKKVRCFLITLLFAINSAFAVDGGDLEKKIDKEIDKAPPDYSKQLHSLKDGAEGVVDQALDQVKKQIADEKKKAMESSKAIGYAYVGSAVSLLASTLIAPQVVMVCKTKPSAILYAGTSAIYIAREMMAFKTFKASQLADIEVVTGVAVDKDQTIKANVDSLKTKVDDQISYIRKYKKTLDNSFKAMLSKASNAKMAGIGFLAASVAAIAEQLNFFSGGGTCVAGSSHLPDQFPSNRLAFPKFKDHDFLVSITQASSIQNQWANFYEWQSYYQGGTYSLSRDEYKALKDIPDVNSENLPMIFQAAISTLKNNLFSVAYADESTKAKTSKMVNVAPALKNKMGDWAGDLDKLGILGGGVVYLVAYMTGWQMSFLKEIVASGISRSVVFAAQATLAYIVGATLEGEAKGFLKKLALIDDILDKAGASIKAALDFIVPSDEDSLRLEKLATKIGIPLPKPLTQMTINEILNYINLLVVTVGEKIDDNDFDFLEKYQDKLKKILPSNIKNSRLENNQNQLMNKFHEKEQSSLQLFVDFLLPQSYAYVLEGSCIEKKSCPNITLPQSSVPSLQDFNQHLNLYEKYSQNVFLGQQKEVRANGRKLLKQKQYLMNLRQNLFETYQKNKAIKIKFSDLEKKKISQDQAYFKNFYLGLTPLEREKLQKTMSSFEMGSGHDAVKIGEKFIFLNSKETPITASSAIGTEVISSDPIFEENKINQDEGVEEFYEFDTIHPIESDLFDIIHRQYVKQYDRLSIQNSN